MSLNPAAELRGVSKSIGGTPAIVEVSLTARSGEILALVGPSGAGKSTLLRLFAGLEAPDRGAVWIAGRDATKLAPSARGIGWTPQAGGLYGHLSVRANLAFGLASRGWSPVRRNERVAELLTTLGLETLAERRPAQLSGGERQRVAFARALAARPEVLLLDEPFAALDPPVRREFRTRLREWSGGAALVLATHDRDDALAADRIALLNAGRMVQAGTPAELRQRPAEPFVGWFLGFEG